MLLPRPTRMRRSEGAFPLSPATRVHAPEPVARLLRALLTPATGLPLPDAPAPGDGVLTFRLAADPELGEEGYRLRVTPTGVVAGAAAEAGLRWAAQTLRQLLPDPVYADRVVRGVDWRLPCVEVTDVPAYAWRGSLLDVARWCHPLPFLYRYVDLLALHKLNTLHLHLTDDQGWRFDVRRYPLLTELGGVRRESPLGHARDERADGVPHGGFYTQRELRDLVDYAALRGVRVMPEIDLPGHTQAAIAAYPELGNDPGTRLPVGTTWGISTHVLNVADATLDFVRDVLDEVVDVFPFEYVHIGGDEVPSREWAASPHAQRRAAQLGLARVADLQGWWTAHLTDHLARRGRRAAAWDEILDRRPAEGTTIFAWRGEDRILAGRHAGHEVVAAPYTHTYFDWAEHDGPDEPLAIAGVLPLERVYGFAPGPVLGVQGQLWSEYLPTTDRVEWRAFPRLAALAEVGWSGAGGDFGEFRGRLAAHLGRLDRLGVNYRPLD
ncbi:hexosaminidase [Micromonospora pattaloongensis]|uniref:beta-N-acetylhexosaminidase n=1 Tax=Micromonospora pattaloongensis TaxID=405436 RepID=A0A1H3Q4L9_9ACTN|nr:beta-N-acetylhexosaminidase [Micromonospora pattaloongensis]SDZ08316.1 hexosaminidase [Micromonospora pattaloongensis]